MIGPAGSGYPTPPGLDFWPRHNISRKMNVHGGASRPSSFDETPTGTPPGSLWPSTAGGVPPMGTTPRRWSSVRMPTVGLLQGISLARLRPSSWMRAAVPTGCAGDARECSARRHRIGAIGSTPSLRLPERFFICLGTTMLSTSQAGRRRPVSSLPLVTRPRIEVDEANVPAEDSRRANSVGQLECEVSDVPLSEVAGCFQDDAPVRRASRLRTTSGGAC
jgi:hypothetical protein